MIVQLTGTLVETAGASVVLDVSGVGYELGVSHATLADPVSYTHLTLPTNSRV